MDSPPYNTSIHDGVYGQPVLDQHIPRYNHDHNHNHNHNHNHSRIENHGHGNYTTAAIVKIEPDPTSYTSTIKAPDRISTTEVTGTNNNKNITPSRVKSSTVNKKKRDGTSLRKAPGAPKRFKSSYIIFFMAKQNEIKAELGKGASVGQVSKKSSEKWRNLSREERAIWEVKAEEDKERFRREKAKYTGPWQIPWKRAKKNPKAPKRPMSAFLFFSQERRRSIKEEHPGMRNTEISRVLGGMWNKAPPEERAPYIKHEAAEREKYKIEIAKWRREEEILSHRAAQRAEEKWEAKKALEEDRDCDNLNHKVPHVSHQASPLLLANQPPRPPSPIPVQSYFPQKSFGDYYPVQTYSGLPSQYNSYNSYPAAPPQSQQTHTPNQTYYRNTYPPAPPHTDLLPSTRHPKDYPSVPPIGRSDSMEEGSRHPGRNYNTLSPIPLGIPHTYGSFTHFPKPTIPHFHDYNNIDQRPPSGSNSNPNYPENYSPPSL